MRTPLSQIIEYKHEVMKAIKASPEIISLMANIPNIDMDSDEACDILENNFFDYSFCDDTFQSDKAVVFVEVAMQSRPSVQFKGLKVMVQVICNKGYAKLDGKLFLGTLGNRRDNIAIEISNVLDGSAEFGVGDLLLTDCEPVSTPNGFTGIGLTFDAVDFVEGDWYED